MQNKESDRVEYKEQLDDNSDKLEAAVVSFLNAKGGNLYIGIKDDGSVAGVDNTDEIQTKIANRLNDSIRPNILGLVDVFTEQQDGKTVIVVNVASGLDTPYYIAKYGRVPKGCYIRMGSSNRQMTIEQIDRMIRSHHRISMTEIPSRHQDLTFRQLKIFYDGRGIDFNDNYMKTLEFFTPDGKYNQLAYLLADTNNLSVRLAKWWGTDKSDMRGNEEYGYCSLIKAMQKVIDKFDVENATQARKIAMKPREEQKLVDEESLHEAIKNAFAHNDYSQMDAPIFEIYSDKFEIISYGGLVSGLSQEEFFTGISRPRNKEIMKIFKDLELVDYHGSGLPKIVRKYGREIYDISENVIITAFPFDERLDKDEGKKIKSKVETGVETEVETEVKTGVKSEDKILSALKKDPYLTSIQLSEIAGIGLTSVDNNLRKLKEQKKLKRIGPKKGGYWKIL